MWRVMTIVAFALLPGTAAACAGQVFEESRFTVCQYRSGRDEIRLVLSDRNGVPLRSFQRLHALLGTDAGRVRFAMNAGMFGGDGNPIGLFVEDSVSRHPLNTADGSGNFYLKPNGVFSVDDDGTPHIEATAAYLARHASPRFATQSGPLLVIDGTLHPLIAPDGPSKNIRNGVGISNANTALFVISDDPVSFGHLARFYRDVLHCPNALYLDGAISSAWIPAENREDHRSEIGPMVVVFEKGANPPR